MKHLFLFLLIATIVHADEPLRVVTAGGAITETVYALGAEKALVGTDSSSTFPESAKKLPQIGYARTLSAEGVLSLKPSLLLVTTDAGPPNVIEQIRTAGVEVLQLSAEHTPDAVTTRSKIIAKAMRSEENLPPLLTALQKDLATASDRVARAAVRQRVLFIYARGGGVMNVSGTDTAADAMIRLAGGINAVSDYSGYKPLTAEAALTAAPDVILVTTTGLNAAGGIDGLLAQPGLALTPAGKSKRVVAMDDLYLLGFGPRLGKATLELATQLHPETQPTLGQAD